MTTPARRGLSSVDGVALLVGVVIGMGVFQTPSLVAARAGGETAALMLWVAGGVISLLGALTYAELAAAYPDKGGEDVFLSKAYGERLALLFGWARLAVIQPGTIAAAGFVAGAYVAPYTPLGEAGAGLVAAALVVATIAMNIAGVAMSTRAQGLLSLALAASLVALTVAGFASPPAAAATAPSEPSTASWGAAMVFVLLAYGGWNEATYLAGEVRRPQRTMSLILVGGVAAVTLFYVGVNWAFLRALGHDGVVATDNV
ncbi:MAG: amino acid permease, partial [Parvularculaceae bacterium]|nr:amino acid permease [Parvularculaceae bacterium]